jgi:hypothetical protein
LFHLLPSILRARRPEIALLSPTPDAAKAEEYFDCAHGRACGFDTLDLTEAKALLDQVHA